MGPGLQAGLAAAGDIVNAGIGWLTQRGINRQQNRYNKNMADYTFNQDIEMWNMQNAYNSPQAQMERYKAAGLNPNLIYGTGTASAGNASGGLPRYQSPSASFQVDPMVQIPGILQQYMDFKVKQAQVDNLKTQNQGMQSDNMVKAINAEVQQIYAKFMAGDKLALLGSQARKTTLEADSAKYSADMKQIEYDQYRRQLMLARDRDELTNQILIQNQIFKEYQNQWMKYGITSGDHWAIRLLSKMILNVGNPLTEGNLKQFLPAGTDWIK